MKRADNGANIKTVHTNIQQQELTLELASVREQLAEKRARVKELEADTYQAGLRGAAAVATENLASLQSLAIDRPTLVDRLRGIYRIPITDGLGSAGGEEPDNPNEFVRHFDVPPINQQAALRIEELEAALEAMQQERDDALEAWRSVLKTEAKVRAQLREAQAEALNYRQLYEGGYRPGTK